jgi:hypothetical protein
VLGWSRESDKCCERDHHARRAIGDVGQVLAAADQLVGDDCGDVHAGIGDGEDRGEQPRCVGWGWVSWTAVRIPPWKPLPNPTPATAVAEKKPDTLAVWMTITVPRPRGRASRYR